MVQEVLKPDRKRAKYQLSAKSTNHKAALLPRHIGSTYLDRTVKKCEQEELTAGNSEACFLEYYSQSYWLP